MLWYMKHDNFEKLLTFVKVGGTILAICCFQTYGFSYEIVVAICIEEVILISGLKYDFPENGVIVTVECKYTRRGINCPYFFRRILIN